MERQDLYIDAQFNGIKHHVQILDTQPEAARYEKVMQLPTTRANNTIYEIILYIDGMDMEENDAKQLVVDILESPIWRAKILGTVHPMPHDAFWNIIFLLDKQHDPRYAVLNAKYENKSLEIQSRVDGQPAFTAIDRVAYPLEAARKIYEASGYIFSDVTTSNPNRSRAAIGMTQAVTLGTNIVAQSIASYLRDLRQPETPNQ